MKAAIQKLISRGFGAGFVLGAVALALSAGQANAGIKDTKHNLSTGATGAASEICVFCHTPHGSQAMAPLWNRNASTTTYSTYTSNTLDTVTDSDTVKGGISAACLSCHDGTQARDSVVNAPGSGTQAAGWAGANGTGTMAAGILANLGSDLTNDHPVAIEYAGKWSTGAAKDPDFKDASTDTVGVRTRYWVDVGASGAGTREKSDMILYTRTTAASSGVAANTPMVECASCHDPHVSTTNTFLRSANDGSQVCLTCHTK